MLPQSQGRARSCSWAVGWEGGRRGRERRSTRSLRCRGGSTRKWRNKASSCERPWGEVETEKAGRQQPRTWPPRGFHSGREAGAGGDPDRFLCPSGPGSRPSRAPRPSPAARSQIQAGLGPPLPILAPGTPPHSSGISRVPRRRDHAPSWGGGRRGAQAGEGHLPAAAPQLPGSRPDWLAGGRGNERVPRRQLLRGINPGEAARLTEVGQEHTARRGRGRPTPSLLGRCHGEPPAPSTAQGAHPRGLGLESRCAGALASRARRRRSRRRSRG